MAAGLQKWPGNFTKRKRNPHRRTPQTNPTDEPGLVPLFQNTLQLAATQNSPAFSGLIFVIDSHNKEAFFLMKFFSLQNQFQLTPKARQSEWSSCVCKQNASDSSKESELSLSVCCSGEPAASGACLGSERSPRGSAPHPGASRTSRPSAGRASRSGMFLLHLNASVSHRIYF